MADSHSGHTESFTRRQNRHASRTEALAFSEKWRHALIVVKSKN